MLRHELWLGDRMLWWAHSLEGSLHIQPSFPVPEGAVWKILPVEPHAPTLDTLHADLLRQMVDEKARDEAFFEGTQWLPDEAKVAATAQGAMAEKERNWARRVADVSGITDLIRGTSKPATPEPPEWKGGLVWQGSNGSLYVLGEHPERKDMAIAYEFASPDPIAEFNERRKAKRERIAVLDEIMSRPLYSRRQRISREEAARAEPLARAMSTPLPHDPTIHDRLMPWRGGK